MSLSLEARPETAPEITDGYVPTEPGLFYGNPAAGIRRLNGEDTDMTDTLLEGPFGIADAETLTEILIARIGGVKVDPSNYFAQLVNPDAKRGEVARVDLHRDTRTNGRGSTNVALTVVHGENVDDGTYVHELAIGSSLNGKLFSIPRIISTEILPAQIPNPITGRSERQTDRYRVLSVRQLPEVSKVTQDGSWTPSLAIEGRDVFSRVARMQASGQFSTNTVQRVR